MSKASANEKVVRMTGGVQGGGQGNAVQLATRDVAPVEPRRYAEGWRAGKPEEDPEKMKRWGLVSAKPSEFLIRMRGGQVMTAGQGGSCFKLPWDSVAVVPTTVQRLQFTADQVTSEKVGVQVTGLAVYRIADPLIAFRMLNYSFPERASEKLEQMLAEMFVGAARRLVANLTVEQCLTKRKEGLATELMKEIAPVVSGSGRPDEHVHKGWGVIIDTIEIQDVRVLSQQVFANMQARFRQDQERLAREAELAKDRALKQGEAEAERQIELARVAAGREIAEQKRSADEEGRLEALAIEARVNEARLAQERAQREAEVQNARKFALDKLEAELAVKDRRAKAEEQEQEAKLAHDRALKEAQAQAEQKLAMEQLEAELSVGARKQQADEEAQRAQLAAELEIERRRLQAEAAKARLGAEVEAARFEAKLSQVQQETQLATAQAALAEARRNQVEVELAILELEQRREKAAQEMELSMKRELKAIENQVSPEIIQLQLAQQLPKIAQAFQQNMGEVHVTAVDGANPFGFVAAAVEGVMGLARSAGLKLPTVQNGSTPVPQ